MCKAHIITDYEDDDVSDTYNLDSDIVDLQANVHKQHPKEPIFNRNGMLSKSCTSTFYRNRTFPKPHLSSQQWHSLQPDAQATWDLLSDEAKAIILGLHKDPGKCTVNLHNISSFDFLQANMHDLQLDDKEDTTTLNQILMMTMEMLESKLLRIPALNYSLFDQTTRFYPSWSPS